MQTIVIKLYPTKLENPDLDLRYLLSEEIEKLSGGKVQEDGYDYLENQALGIWLKAESATATYPEIVQLIKEKTFLGNDLSLSAELYIAEKEAEDIENCLMVFPE